MLKSLKYGLHSYLLLSIALVQCLACNGQQNRAAEIRTVKEVESWELIFEDEFNNDLTLWNVWNSGAFNEEIQMYRTEQLRLENGILKIHAQREAITGASTIHDATPKRFEYVSGRIESKQQFGPSDKDGEREYRFVARIKLPAGHGMWPAFWTYGDPWPTQGEIDILEARGGRPMEYLSNLFFGTTPGVNVNQGADVLHKMSEDLTAVFHTYEMIWKTDTIAILLDGTLLHTYTANATNNIANFFGKKQKVVLNTAVGGTFFKDRNSPNYVDRATMEIDWVRVYKR